MTDKTVVVPVEPTPEMIDAALRLHPKFPRCAMHVAIEDAIAAAPTPPAENIETVMELEHEGRRFTVPGWIGPHIAELLAKDKTAGEWLPIETAPKDGTSILITGGTYSTNWDAGLEFHGVSIAYWCRGFEPHWRGNNLQAHDEWCRHQPTQWMPLPAAPTREAGSA